jgi:regulator of protease activity HflC (stomatin/prohibitin superfamily)
MIVKPRGFSRSSKNQFFSYDRYRGYFMIWFTLVLFFFLSFIIYKSINIIPYRMVYIVERLGKYDRTLDSGLRLVFPVIDRIAYKHSLKEKALEVPKQICITKDNISVEVDGILYLQIIDPHKASYGINDYLFATIQITQTTMRSVIGKLDLDQTFRERENINAQIVGAIEVASGPWGVKVNRYEIKDIKPPQTVNDAMEKQMRAEREKRAVIAQSEGEKQACINRAEGQMEEVITRAKAKAVEIEKLSLATAEGLMRIAHAIKTEGGKDAVSLQLAEQYIKEFGNLAKTNNTMIIPSNLADLSSVVSSATSIISNTIKKGSTARV